MRVIQYLLKSYINQIQESFLDNIAQGGKACIIAFY